MDVLERSLSYDEVTEIFVRVNSLGAKLRSSDLALAQITAKWPGSLRVFQEFQTSCERRGFDLDLGVHLRNLVAFATGQSRFLTVGRMPVTRLQTAWNESVPGMDFALNFVRANAGIDNPALLSSPSLLVALAYYGHKRRFELAPEEAKRLRQWVLIANAKGRYSRGSSESILDQDLAVLRDGGGVSDLIERLRAQVGRLDITAEELIGRNQRSALFKTMFLAFRDAEAKDWRSNIAIAFSHGGASHKLQFHHVFPKALLRAHYGQREIDDIANLSFIGGGTNRDIRATPPGDYFKKILHEQGSAPFDAQCIPLEPEVLSVERYKDFLSKRRALITKRLNEFLGSEHI